MFFTKNTIFSKIFRLLFVLFVFVSIPLIIYSISTQKKMLLDSLEVEAKDINRFIEFALSDALLLNDNSAIVEFLIDYSKKNEKLENIIISKENNDYIIIEKNSWSFEPQIDQKYKDLEKNVENSLLFKSPILNTQVFHHTFPIYSSGIHLGWIHLSMSLDEYNKRLETVYLGFFTFFIILLGFSLFISYILSKSISDPIVSLNNVVSNISKGNLKLRSNYESDDEVGALAQGFNTMISAIDETQIQLKLSHEKLEERVELRTKDLDNTNKLLETKTTELEELNKSLDKKIKEEIEKRIQQESILIQQSRLAATGEMIGNIAHQWRQPLSLITTCASGIKLEKEFGVSSVESEVAKLDTIIQSSNYLSKTIDDFRNFFKPNKEKKYFSVMEMLEQSITLISASFNFHYIKINKNFDEVSDVNGYPNEFSQAVLNILSNAKDAIIDKNIENPYINVSIYENKDFVFLEIEDNAKGIAPEIISKIFDPYFTTKEKKQGTGIGLYMSKMIIEKNMNGKLSIENTVNGAKFIFAVPKN